jgi:hypothetical protein
VKLIARFTTGGNVEAVRKEIPTVFKTITSEFGRRQALKSARQVLDRRICLPTASRLRAPPLPTAAIGHLPISSSLKSAPKRDGRATFTQRPSRT